MPLFVAIPQPVAVFPKVFISYCWVNSHDAVKKGTREVKGSLGYYDPRRIKEYLEGKGISVWMDIEKVAQVKCDSIIIEFGDVVLGNFSLDNTKLTSNSSPYCSSAICYCYVC
jgi:hypothetical protein